MLIQAYNLIKNRITKFYYHLFLNSTSFTETIFRWKSTQHRQVKIICIALHSKIYDTSHYIKIKIINWCNLMTKNSQSKSNLHNCLIAKSQQLNQLYNSSLIDFSLTFNVDCSCHYGSFDVEYVEDISYYDLSS